MPHPWTWLPARTQKPAFLITLMLTLLLLVVLQVINAPLRSAAAPSGIVAYELAGTPAATQAILASWDVTARVAAGLSLGLDYLFIAAYASSIGLACALTSQRFAAHSWLRHLGVALAWALLVAATCDMLENYALIRLLLGSASTSLPAVARLAALIKFTLVGLGMVYALLAGLLSRRLHRA
ncbi:MAG: hypothetical protein WAZ19_01550 [Anaerolineae bacterium]